MATTHDLDDCDQIGEANILPQNRGDNLWSGAANWADGTHEALFVLSSGDHTPNSGSATNTRLALEKGAGEGRWTPRKL